MDWLHASWGKFRNWQRTMAESERLPRAQLTGARALWDYLHSEGADADEDQLRSGVTELVESMNSDGRHGSKVFAAWLKVNRENLSKPVARSVAESAQTTDHVAVQLSR